MSEQYKGKARNKWHWAMKIFKHVVLLALQNKFHDALISDFTPCSL